MRISVIGGPASGKTYFAERISKKLSIPHIHLDRFWFDAGGLKEDGINAPPEVRERIRAYVQEKATPLLGQEHWVSDGFYSRGIGATIAEKADVILFLDIPLWRRLLNHAQRIFKPSTRHKELNFWHEIKFFHTIIYRAYARGPKMYAFAELHKNKVVVLRSRKEIRKYLESVAK